MEDVIVIGGGAAGMLAAIGAARNVNPIGKTNAKVILLEQNEKLGKKLFITGKGRCNLTNACEIEDFFNAVMVNYQFLYSSVYGFTNMDIIALLEENGCSTKVERGNRVFPVSDHSSDVIAALKRALKKERVEIRLKTRVKELLIRGQICEGVLLDDGTKLMASRVIVATGGISYPSTGATGDGYRFAKQCGHRIVQTQPALVPLETVEEYPKQLMGLSLRNVCFTLRQGKKTLYQEQGEMLFTHFGISGPLVLSASSHLPRNQQGTIENLTAEIDLKPALSEKQLDERILRDFNESKNKAFKNVLEGLLPSKLIPVMVELSKIDGSKKVHDITKEERLKLLTLLKHLPLHIKKTRDYNEAIITAGGIDVKEINPGTMESKLVKKVYFAGEVLDLDALTGGYNLQIAWSTGYAAGNCEIN